MSITFPASLDSFQNPTATDQVASVTVPHAEQHANANDAIEALEAKVGADGSAVTTSHDYKLSGVTGSDKASSLAGAEILSNKTLTAPKLANGGFIADANGNELIEGTTTASAVNHINTTNAATGNDPLIDAKGSDTNISLKIKAKGTGKVKIGAVDLQFPNVDGSASQVLTTNGSGVLSWATPSSGVSVSTTITPQPVYSVDTFTYVGRSTTTSMTFALVDIPQTITANSISFYVNAYTSSGTYKLALFSQDGQTKIFEVTTATISAGSQTITTALSAVTIPAGQYMICGVPTGGNFELGVYDAGGLWERFLVVTGKKYLSGIKTVTASTIPSTFDPTASVTNDRFAAIQFRLDNL